MDGAGLQIPRAGTTRHTHRERRPYDRQLHEVAHIGNWRGTAGRPTGRTGRRPSPGFRRPAVPAFVPAFVPAAVEDEPVGREAQPHAPQAYRVTEGAAFGDPATGGDRLRVQSPAPRRRTRVDDQQRGDAREEKNMPPRSQPTERQRRLGAELKKLRLGAGLSGDGAAATIDADRQRISNIEAGRLDVPRNGLYPLLRAYNCPEGPLFDGLMAMAQDRGRGWWDEYSGLMQRPALDLAELESRSELIRAHELMFIPGLLQTPDYTRAVLEAAGKARSAIHDYVRFRIARQQVLSSDTPTELHAVVHEAALHACVGDTDVMRGQLVHLIEAARKPNITIQVFPYSAGMFSAFSNTFTICGGSPPPGAGDGPRRAASADNRGP